MATVVERERKYSGDDGFRLPDLTGCGGVATTSDATALDLDAVYLDTADLRLARSGFALRRRTGGHDAGWHLKIGAAGPAATLVRRLKQLQDRLGGHQDSAVAREVLRRAALRAYADGENAFTYGLLHAREAATADRDLPAVARARDRVRRRKLRRWLRS